MNSQPAYNGAGGQPQPSYQAGYQQGGPTYAQPAYQQQSYQQPYTQSPPVMGGGQVTGLACAFPSLSPAYYRTFPSLLNAHLKALSVRRLVPLTKSLLLEVPRRKNFVFCLFSVGIILAIVFFPVGILCCLLLQEDKCKVCGYVRN